MDWIPPLRALAASIPAACLLLLPTDPATAGSNSQAVVALHVTSHTTKATTICTTHSPNAQGIPCSGYNTRGSVGVNQDVYLAVGHGDPVTGVAGLRCRIWYDNRPNQGVDVFGWYLCADHEIPGDGGQGPWPASGGTNRITWDPAANCQKTEIAGEGVHAVAGAFYVYAYSSDALLISGADSGLSFEITDCGGTTTVVGRSVPQVNFTPYGSDFGLNPCDYYHYVPQCPVSPESVRFPTIWAGGARDTTILVRNEGLSVLKGSWSVTGEGFFLLSSGAPFTLEPGAEMPVSLRFALSRYGSVTGGLRNGCSPGIVLLGRADPLGSFSPDRLAFDSTAVGESRIRTTVLRNTHPETWGGTAAVSGEGFRLAPESRVFTLAPGDSATFPVFFEPTAAKSHSGQLSVGALCPPVSLSGVGIPACGVAPATRSFGTLLVGSHLDIDFTVTNNLSEEISGRVSSSGSPFSVLAGGGSYLLAPGGSHEFTIRFEPLAAGTFTGTVSFGGPCASMAVTGAGRAPIEGCTVLPSSQVQFGLTQMEMGKTETVRFVNKGEAALALELREAGLLPHFSLPDGEGFFSIAPGDTLPVRLRYAPLTTGVHVGTLATNSRCAEVKVSGFAQRSPVDCIADAPSLDFGDVPVGGSMDLAFHLFNYSGEQAVGTIAASCDAFSVLNEGFYELAWADSLPVTVRFAPLTEGPHACAVAVTGSCGDTIEITGNGVAVPDTAAGLPLSIFPAGRPDEAVQRLAYTLDAEARVRIVVYSVAGAEVARFDEGTRGPGRYEVPWDAREQSAGIYFARVETGRAACTCRVLLLR